MNRNGINRFNSNALKTALQQEPIANDGLLIK